MCQTAFIKGRGLHEGVLALHKIIHDVRVKKSWGIFLKLNFEKACDRVNWEFLRTVLSEKVLNQGWFIASCSLLPGDNID
jgi:hypothetical protein